MKRKSLDIQKLVLKEIKKRGETTLSSLERKIRTNPNSLREHCEALRDLGLIKVIKTKETTKLIYTE